MKTETRYRIEQTTCSRESNAAVLDLIGRSAPIAITEIDESTIDSIENLLSIGRILKIPQGFAGTAVDGLIRNGARRCSQYEAVRDGLVNTVEFTALARVGTTRAQTSATKAASTLPHIDGYQFWYLYRNFEIAGIGNMPDLEVLSYPILTEPRDLVFYDTVDAARRLLDYKGWDALYELTKRNFTIKDKYLRADPALRDPGRLSFIYEDRGKVRFHIGGSVFGLTPAAQYSLELFNAFLVQGSTILPVEAGFTYISNPSRAAHAGVRWPGVDGGTHLVRQLLRFEDRATEACLTGRGSWGE